MVTQPQRHGLERWRPRAQKQVLALSQHMLVIGGTAAPTTQGVNKAWQKEQPRRAFASRHA
jgi:hypothetical protein